MRNTKSSKKPPSYPSGDKAAIKYSGQLTVQSYIDNGLELPIESDKLNYEQEEFLSKVNIEKGPIRKELFSMTRLKALTIDPETKKRSYREYLIYEEWWYGVDFLGREIAPATNMEGIWFEQEIKPEFDEETNKRIIGYEWAGQHPVYTIPFSKSAVDKIFKEYGIEDKEAVRYIVRFDGPGVPYKSRSYKWTYDQFTTLTYDVMLIMQFRPDGMMSYRKLDKKMENKLDATK